ncbi:hypothetical protein ACFOU2_11545 [Bacillus songklensis]|uniref:Uncharacterized protein n=1 Tax=Bacillus songklensis TaxID=1069116 RepID=A0ABV8B3A7_9BACI
MFRGKMGDQEIIILFSSAISKSFDEEKDIVYKQILSVGERILSFQDGTSFTVADPSRLIVAEVKKHDLVTVYVQHIIEKPFMYDVAKEEDQAG